MAHIVIPQGMRTVVRGHAAEGQELEMVFHTRGPSANPSASDCHVVNLTVQGWVLNNYKNMWNTGVEATDVTTTSIAQVPGPQDSLVLGYLGSRIGLFVTPATTFSVKSTTGLSGRTNRGRTYAWPFVVTDLLTPGEDRVTDSYRTAIVGVLNNLVGSLAGAGYPMVIRSGVDAALKPVVRYVAVDDYIDSQRRRLLGRGS